MYKYLLLAIFVLISVVLLSQEKMTELPSKLKESSALLKIENQFLTINDSGGNPVVYFFDEKGKILREVTITNAKNRDWEAITYDKNHLYIGDFGNNANKRKDLVIYKVSLQELLKNDQVQSESIHFSYSEQTSFPPEKSKMYYDAEAMIVQNNEIIVITKNRTNPYDGKSKLYSIPTQPGKYIAKLVGEIQLPATNWLENSVTDAFLFQNQDLYLLTYAHIYKYRLKNKSFVKINSKELDSITQKEGIFVDENYIYLTDENEMGLFKANYLWRMKRF